MPYSYGSLDTREKENSESCPSKIPLHTILQDDKSKDKNKNNQRGIFVEELLALLLPLCYSAPLLLLLLSSFSLFYFLSPRRYIDSGKYKTSNLCCAALANAILVFARKNVCATAPISIVLVHFSRFCNRSLMPLNAMHLRCGYS